VTGTVKIPTLARAPLAAIAVCALACGYDPSDRCSPNQVLDGEYCVCAPGYVITARGDGFSDCKPCGVNEVAEGGRCVCAAGSHRSAADQPCSAGSAGLACADASACGADAPVCFHPTAASGYCTTPGCATGAACPAGWTCESDASGSHCKRPPVGQGATCASSAQCAAYEATLCGAPYLGQCLVEGCAVGAPGACSPGFNCCDLTALGLAKTVCVPLAECPGSKP
jgi:hypothetical protein